MLVAISLDENQVRAVDGNSRRAVFTVVDVVDYWTFQRLLLFTMVHGGSRHCTTNSTNNKMTAVEKDGWK